MNDQALKELIKAIPPTPNPRYSKVNWDKLEERVGLPYPESFKEYVSVYGGGAWCDWWHPFFCAANSDAELDDFMQTMSNMLASMRKRGMTTWGHGEDVNLPIYPEKGGLLPFLIDFDNICLCLWKTNNPDPDEWPVICWIDHQIGELRGITIAGMIVEWLNRTKRMTKVWGDVRDVDHDEIKFTKT